MRLLKTHSHTSNGLAMEPGTREEKQLKETQTLQQGKSTMSTPCRVPPVWRGGGAEKALEPAAYHRCGGGGQKRLYGKPNTEKGTMARRTLVDMEGNTGANTREKSYQKPPAGHRHGGGLGEDTTNTRDERWRHLQLREEGKSLAKKRKRNKYNTHKKKHMTHRPVHSPVPRYARTGYPGRPPALGSGGRRRGEIEQRRKSDSPAPQIAAFYPNTGPTLSRGFGRTILFFGKNHSETGPRLSEHHE